MDAGIHAQDCEMRASLKPFQARSICLWDQLPIPCILWTCFYCRFVENILLLFLPIGCTNQFARRVWSFEMTSNLIKNTIILSTVIIVLKESWSRFAWIWGKGRQWPSSYSFFVKSKFPAKLFDLCCAFVDFGYVTLLPEILRSCFFPLDEQLHFFLGSMLIWHG